MVKALKQLSLFIILTCLTLASASSAYARIVATASVDRSSISVDETLRLTVRINDTGTYKTPDLSHLANDFQVLGSSQSSRHSLVNGKSTSVTEWTFSLFPKRDGTLNIPSIKINDARTAPIRIQVVKNAPIPKGKLDTVFIEASSSHTQAYIQQQIIFTLRIFQSIELSNLNISNFEVENATSKKIGQNSFYRTINGVRHRVHEINYALIPQKPGKLTIPAQVFTASKDNFRSRYQQSGSSLVRRNTDAISIDVKDIPSSFKNSTWLPAQKLTLTESWSNESKTIRVGESVTRTITTQAEGLMGSQLPPIEFTSIPGLKLYPDQSETSNSETPAGMSSQRIDSTALIPTKSGFITLPEISIKWWDINANTIKVARIPAKKIEILPGLEQQKDNNASAFDRPPQVDNQQVTVIKESNPIWIWISAILGILWLATLIAYIRLRKQPSKPSNTGIIDVIHSEKQAFKALQRACRDNKHEKIRNRLLQWAKLFWPQASLNCFDDIIKHSQHHGLQAMLLEFDHSLYANKTASTSWNAQSLLVIINELRKTKVKKETKEKLPELYR